MKKLTAFLIMLLTITSLNAQKSSIPHLKRVGNTTQLMVNDVSFLMRAGELHNSSTGSAHHMKPIWHQMAQKNLNTVIAAVSWELIEPKEGVFDFCLVDSMLTGARKENLKLVLIWFGSWKNGKSTYRPEWVKTNVVRFPLVKDQKGNLLDILSTFGNNSLKSDARAYTELLKHLHQVDSKEQTVVMIQVENEMGVLDFRSSYGMPNIYMRDFSDMANQAFMGQVPKELIGYMEQNKDNLHPALKKAWTDNGNKKTGSWEDVFGKGTKYVGDDWKNNYSYYTEEIFMAWNYAKYVGEIAKAGRAEYNIPMYVNAWLKQTKGRDPGQYPSGGPVPHVLDIWRAAAPAIDFIAPDIYTVDEFDWVSETFSNSGNPLFIPETTSDMDGATRAFYAFGKYDALGYAPFGIDGGGLLLSANPNDHSFDKVYSVIKDITPLINKYRGTEDMSGLYIDGNKKNDTVVMGEYIISLKRFTYGTAQGLVGVEVAEKTKIEDIASSFIVIKLSKDEFLLAGGMGNSVVNISKSSTNKSRNVSYASIDEITYEKGKIKTHRLNGDETAFGGPVVRLGEAKVFKVRMYTY
jgi:hypothetical protein